MLPSLREDDSKDASACMVELTRESNFDGVLEVDTFAAGGPRALELQNYTKMCIYQSIVPRCLRLSSGRHIGFPSKQSKTVTPHSHNLYHVSNVHYSRHATRGKRVCGESEPHRHHRPKYARRRLRFRRLEGRFQPTEYCIKEHVRATRWISHQGDASG